MAYRVAQWATGNIGTKALKDSGDELATGVLMGHRDPRTTRRYTLGAVDARHQRHPAVLALALERDGFQFAWIGGEHVPRAEPIGR